MLLITTYIFTLEICIVLDIIKIAEYLNTAACVLFLNVQIQ